MNPDEVNALWQRAIDEKAKLAEEMFANGMKPTEDYIIAVALAHPEAYEIRIHLKED